MHVQRSSCSDTTSLVRSTEAGSSPDYEVLTGERTVSKSLLSKAKNLLYSLSRPFRALARQFVANRLGDGDMSAAIKNIKSAPPQNASPAKATAELAPQPERGYTIVSSKGGHREPSVFDRLWG